MSRSLSIYRFGAKVLSETLRNTVMPRRASFQVEMPGGDEPRVRSAGEGPTIWFHGASAGELESLWPIIELWAERPGRTIVTAFSESGLPQLRGMAQMLRGKLTETQRLGLSPLEGFWGAEIERARPSMFVTAKYEAWPELWAELARRGIPLAVVGARDRRSLRVAAKMSALLAGRQPRLLLLTAEETENGGLRARFPGAEIISTGEPRWDRVRRRGAAGNPRASELAASAREAGAAAPWGVLGQVWREDLRRWRGILERGEWKGTLWIVPHRVDGAALEAVLSELSASGVRFVRTRGKPLTSLGESRVIVVDEMGILSELYASADWVFVGGGFGAGVHSTIEPAIYSIPVASGPQGADRFTETEILRRSGQLRIVGDSSDIEAWLGTATAPNEALRARWKADLATRFGASERALETMLKFVSRP